MGIFDFGKKQRMHTQVFGHTTGKEMFQVDEFNSQNKKIGSAVVVDFSIFAILYFYWSYITPKVIIFMLIIASVMGCVGYFAYKSKRRLREKLY